MKKVLKISVGGNFQQFLLLSEIRFIINMCKDFGTPVSVELVYITKVEYKFYFDKQ